MSVLSRPIIGQAGRIPETGGGFAAWITLFASASRFEFAETAVPSGQRPNRRNSKDLANFPVVRLSESYPSLVRLRLSRADFTSDCEDRNTAG